MGTTTSTRTAALVVLLGVALSRAFAVPASPAAPCSETLTRQIPARSAAAPGGSEFVQQIRGMSDDERESAILGQLLLGNMPAFLRRLAPVTLSGHLSSGRFASVTVCVSPDYLAIGSDQNFLLVPMRLQTALTVASRFRFALPTPRIVDAIYAQALVHLQPRPLPASDTMRTTAYYWEHNELVREQRLALPEPLGMLTAGDKKDLVLTNRLWSHLARVAIYGWHRPDGRPIQPLSTLHGARYADYSHGIRLVSATAYVDGKAMPLLTLLQDPRMASLFSDEGVIRHAADLVSVLGSRSSAASETAAAPIH
jgi:hypothetical protein